MSTYYSSYNRTRLICQTILVSHSHSQYGFVGLPNPARTVSDLATPHLRWAQVSEPAKVRIFLKMRTAAVEGREMDRRNFMLQFQHGYERLS
jgi:hypothetical protein